MTTSADTAAKKYPHTTETQRRIVATYGEHLNNTGGNDPLDLLERIATQERLLSTNLPVAILAMSVSSQITLLATLEKAGAIGGPEFTEQWQVAPYGTLHQASPFSDKIMTHAEAVEWCDKPGSMSTPIRRRVATIDGLEVSTPWFRVPTDAQRVEHPNWPAEVAL